MLGKSKAFSKSHISLQGPITNGVQPIAYQTPFFILNSAEHEIYPAHKC